ncbi:MAG: hypothetical protein ACRCVG_02715 [Methanobacteriaceae archaeon]
METTPILFVLLANGFKSYFPDLDFKSHVKVAELVLWTFKLLII